VEWSSKITGQLHQASELDGLVNLRNTRIENNLDYPEKQGSMQKFEGETGPKGGGERK
jgi:hypothetical protein